MTTALRHLHPRPWCSRRSHHRARPTAIRVPLSPEARKANASDVVISARLGAYQITPRTRKGERWIHDNVFTESWQWQRGALCLDDQHYVHPILDGMRRDGLRVRTGARA